MSESEPTKPKPPASAATPAQKPATKPKRAAAPTARPTEPTLNKPGTVGPRRSTQVPFTTTQSDALSELAAIAGSTVAPSSASPSGSTFSAIRQSMPALTESAAARQAASNRATLVPPCFVLGVTLPILGIAWFTLERHRVLRDNPIGIGIPILLFIGGALFLGLLAMMLLGPRARGRNRLASTGVETSGEPKRDGNST